MAGSGSSRDTGGVKLTTAGSLYCVVVRMGVPASAVHAVGMKNVLRHDCAIPGPHTRKSLPRLWVCELSWYTRDPSGRVIVRHTSAFRNGGTFCTKMSVE